MLNDAKDWLDKYPGNIVGERWPCHDHKQRGRGRLYQNCSLLLFQTVAGDGSRLQYVNWHSDIWERPTWCTSVGCDRHGKLSFSVPRPGWSTDWKDATGALVVCHDIGVRMWKNRTLRDHIPDPVVRLQRAWLCGITPSRFALAESCNICNSPVLTHAASCCPLCLRISHVHCAEKLSSYMQGDEHVGCIGDLGHVIPPQWTSPLCAFCSTFISSCV